MEFEKIQKGIFNPVNENREKFKEAFGEKLSELFPSAVSEDEIDFRALLAELGEYVDSEERYGLNWAGKMNAKKIANEDVVARTLKYVPEDSKNPETTENLYIEGDNLEVLKLLRNSYYNKVKMIYIDPPYNTGRNLIYKNDYAIDKKSYLLDTNDIDELGNKLVANPRNSGRFHSDWLSMMYQRLKVAKQLLTEDGVLVCAIDENEQATLMLILQEIFDEQCYDHVCVSVVHNPRGVQGVNFSYVHEYAIFVFPKGKKVIADRHIDEEDVNWSQLRNWGGESERTDAKNCFYPILVKDGTIIGFGDVCEDSFHPAQTEYQSDIAYVYPIDRNGIERKWRYARQSVEAIKDMLRVRKTTNGYEIEIGKQFGLQKTIWNDKKYDANEYGTKIVNDLVPGGGFTFPKSLYSVYDAVYTATINDKSAIILDFFSGSATTAHAVMQLNAEDGGNRKFIMVQLPEKTDNPEYKNICEIGKERIRRAGEKILEENADKEGTENLDVGFKVFRTGDTNIRWISDAIENDHITWDESMMRDKDRLDFNPGYTDMDVVYEILLRHRAIPLSARIERLNEIGERTYLLADAILVCLDESVTEEMVDRISEVEPLPSKIIFRDSAFGDDISLKENTMVRLQAQMKKQSGVDKKAYRIEFI